MAKYSLTASSSFKKDFKRYRNRTRELRAIAEVMSILESGAEAIPQQMKPHKLIGNYKGLWECHIFPDLLLIWQQEGDPVNEIHLIRLGSHSDLFS